MWVNCCIYLFSSYFLYRNSLVPECVNHNKKDRVWMKIFRSNLTLCKWICLSVSHVGLQGIRKASADLTCSSCHFFYIAYRPVLPLHIGVCFTFTVTIVPKWTSERYLIQEHSNSKSIMDLAAVFSWHFTFSFSLDFTPAFFFFYLKWLTPLIKMMYRLSA